MKLSRWFKIKAEVRVRSSRDGQNLSGDEIRYIYKYHKCPDCRVGDLLGGPSGGGSTNCLCSKCGSKYNLTGGLFDQRLNHSSLYTEPWKELGILFKMKEL